MRSNTSLNGGQIRPLTNAARTVLTAIATAPVPLPAINPGIRNRLTRGPVPLAVRIDAPSPHKKDRGEPCPHLVATEAGRAVLRGEPDPNLAHVKTSASKPEGKHS